MRNSNKTINKEQMNNTSGILLDSELKIKAYTGKINKVYVVIVQCILIFCAVIFSMFSFIDGLDVKIDTTICLLIAIAAVILNYIAFLILRYNDNSKMAIIIIFLYLLYFMLDTEKIGKVSVRLGAGRLQKEDQIDYTAGIILNKKTGDYVNQGELLATLCTSNLENIDEIKDLYLEAINISSENNIDYTLIYDIIQ